MEHNVQFDSFEVDLECFSCADRNVYVLANIIRFYVKHSILAPNAPLLWILLLGSRFSTHFTTKTYTLSIWVKCKWNSPFFLIISQTRSLLKGMKWALSLLEKSQTANDKSVRSTKTVMLQLRQTLRLGTFPIPKVSTVNEWAFLKVKSRKPFRGAYHNRF